MQTAAFVRRNGREPTYGAVDFLPAQMYCSCLPVVWNLALLYDMETAAYFTMTATIKTMEITEAAGLDPTCFKPDDREDFASTFGLTVGPKAGDGGELFYGTVCTPKHLEKLCKRDGFVWGRHHLIVPYLDLERIRAIFSKFVNNCSGLRWQDIVPKLARLGAWEFEDYRDPSAP